MIESASAVLGSLASPLSPEADPARILLARLTPEAQGDPVDLMVSAGMEPDPWQADFLRARPQRALLLCCRQAGKSTVTAAAALSEAISHAGSTSLLVSRSQRQSAELLAKVKGFAAKMDPKPKMAQESVLSLGLANGSRIISLPGRPEVIRGYSADLLVIDEAAFVPSALYEAIRPMLAVTQGRLIALSTPFGRQGWYYDAWEGDGSWHRTQVTAYDVPRIAPEFLAEERATLPEHVFASEYLAQFTADVEGALWDRGVIESWSVEDHAPKFWRSIVIGIDPSDGKASSDEQALCVVGQSAEDSNLYVLHSEGWREEPWTFLNRACDIAETYYPNHVQLVIEKNHGGEWITATLEQLFRQRTRIPYRLVNASRNKLTRAEPVAALYRRGRVHHVGRFPKLEVQMTSFAGKPGERSPDRLDALVWACWPFIGNALDTSEVAGRQGGVYTFANGASEGVYRYSPERQAIADTYGDEIPTGRALPVVRW